jgi:hypothetical protein
MLTDTQRVEMALPARIMFNVIKSGIKDLQDPDAVKLMGLLKTACFQPFEDLTTKHKHKVIRRTERIYGEAILPFQGERSDKVGLILFYFLKDLIDRELLILYEGTPFADAMEMTLPMLHHAFDIPELDKSAQKQARRLKETFQKHGYYAWA